MQKATSANSEFIPQFRFSFFLPRYWGIWFGVGIMLILAYIPATWRNPFLGKLGKWVGRLAKGARRRARINLYYCMPELDHQEREALIDNMFSNMMQTLILLAEQGTRHPDFLLKRTRWHGYEIVEKMIEQKKNVIFLVPHGWAVDIPAMLFAAKGINMAAMFHNQRNLLVDWMWNVMRRRFGGRMHARVDGIKPFIKSIRQGYWGFYLPDQDHGAEHSVFADFFATYKATLPVLGRLMKVTDATIIPLFPVYRGKKGILDIYIRPPMENLAKADDEGIARAMNQEVEYFVKRDPEQYTWLLKLLKTRKKGDKDPYSRQDI